MKLTRNGQEKIKVALILGIFGYKHGALERISDLGGRQEAARHAYQNDTLLYDLVNHSLAAIKATQLDKVKKILIAAMYGYKQGTHATICHKLSGDIGRIKAESLAAYETDHVLQGMVNSGVMYIRAIVMHGNLRRR